MTDNKFNGITHFSKGKRSFCTLLLAIIFLLTTSTTAYAVKAPTANPPAGTYGGKQNVELKTETVAASVYYTTDGTEPTTGSTPYTDLINVASNMTIKAFAMDGTVSSEVYAFEYIIFDGGSGTVEDPYRVATAEQLNNVRYHLDKHFIQTADINLGIAPYNADEGWEPIGSYSPYAPFTGTFDGNGKTISNLTIKRTESYVGLFGFAKDSHIKNVKLENVDITGQDNVGGLVGYNYYGTVINSYATGTVKGSKYVGGLVGQTFYGTITNSYATATVNGTNQVGGLVGLNDNGMISEAYATGAVTAGTSTAGGLVGDNFGTITNSYATGAVTGINAGGLVGVNHQDDVVSNSYWDIDTSGMKSSAGGEGKTTAEMKLPETYVGWDFKDIWGIEGTRNNGYPFLLYNAAAAPSANPPAGTYIGTQNVTLATATGGATIYYTTDNSEPTTSSHQYTTAIEVSSNTIIKAIAVKDGMDNSLISTFEYFFFAGGSGTEADPYQVATPEQLNNVRKHLDKHFIQTADIDLGVTPYNEGEGWEPIGNGSSLFTGTFDGNGRIISNLTINRSTTDHIGLFGSTGDTAKIKNIKLNNIDIKGQTRVGGLVGYNAGTIANSYAAGIVKGTNKLVGGLVGFNYYGTITNSFTTGAVTGTQLVGGLVGSYYYGTITDSYAKCAVTGTNYIGGLVGSNYYGTITNSFTTGAVTGTQLVGGLVGETTPDIRFVSNSYWDIDTSGMNSSAGGEGKTTEEMKLPGTYVGWDFTNTWSLEAGKNKGYPFLKDNTPIAAAPSANPPAGTYIGTQNITLFTATEGATIYYTTDNSQPTTGSPQYTSAIEISSNTIIKAIAVKDGLDNSPVSTFAYVVMFAGGDGSVDNPYQIATPEQLDHVRNYLDKHFIQTADIDLNVAPYNANEGWKPIGEEGFEFKGTFNGNGKTISNLTIKRSSGGGVGLFGFTKNTAQIKNVKLRKINVTGGYNVGGLVGYNYGTITNSYATGDVTGIEKAGGLVGYNQGNIANSYAAGIVKANDCGGLVGYNLGTINNSYARGAVHGDHFVGGLVATNYNAENVKKSYWDTTTSGRDSSAAGIGKITTDMKLQGTYVDWDFTNVWNIDDSMNDGYPFLKNNPPYTTPATKYSITVANVVGGTATITTNPVTEAAAGETVTVSIDGIEPGKQFKSITVTDTDGGAVTTTEVTAGSRYTFTMPTKAVTVIVAVEAIPIVSATINPTTITFNKNLEAPADVSTTINWNSATSVTVVKQGNATLTANADYVIQGNTLTIKKEYLATQETSALALTVEFNKGNAATLIITILDTISTDKALISITAPSAITGIANGADKTAAALGLPAKVTLVTNGGNAEADVSWDVAACSYNPAVTTEQTFTVSGTVTLPTGVVNPNSVPLTTSISVTVNARPSPPPPWYPVSGVTLDKSSLTLEVNGPAQKLAATVQPSYASNPYVYWNSSDTEVARVDYTGLVTPVAPGQAIITATTSEGGKTASCTVEVLARIEGIKLNKASTTITEGNSETLKATLIPENSKQNISWSSDDSSIATVDSEGLVTGISPGTTFITVRTVEGDFSANCTVTVMATITATAEETIVLHDEPVSINIPPEVEATIEVTPGSTMPQVNINSSTALGTVEIQIPEGTIASSPDGWDGTFKLPTISNQPSAIINGASQVHMVIVLGLEDEQISFSQAVRILIPGQAQQQVGYIRNGVFTPITRILSADRQDVADSEIPADGDGKIDVGSDLVVWTKHFTEFVTYTPISNPEPVSYTVSLSSNYAKAGTVSGDGTFYGGSLITVRAQAQSGYVFDNWSENGCMLSRDSVYSFNLGNSSRQLQANFVREFQEISITDATKPRIITFSHPVLPGEQNLGNIYVATDINGDNKVEGVIVEGVSGNNCQISVKPPGGQWLAGASYYLILEPGLQSALNKTLGIRTRIKFTVE
ncbi:chitobiase/beta-hexosaminidase C-terminal domain-containing protein [Syntrophomonas wolfei]|uniref:Surface proteins containing Ig-like domains-like n=1 Tax=Syntrophomonas wolfei subsp. wolfei (strain DSM 2245B / Goettingen) TaxID=335541 RepID=Q0AY18_SYNWW|nr:chitobiase/beta-hexosaminidase C-terminal domain-containing protein [Syntrophomonas wolfei]ABI68386.1 surface proteins containing Ig-like domains-like [Syntrophomonas wolfei subsp. wolfei str. Goettingen G311]